VDRIGLPAQLSAAANNEEVAPPFERLTSVASTSYTNGRAEDRTRPSTSSWPGSASADDPDLCLFAERLINLARVHGKAGAADEVERRFGGDRAEEDGSVTAEDFEPPRPDEPGQ
jgi:hypothetical protein